MTLEIVPFYSIGQITVLYNIGISYITLHHDVAYKWCFHGTLRFLQKYHTMDAQNMLPFD